MKIQSDSLRMNWTDHDSDLQVCVIDFNGVVVDDDNEIEVKEGDELFRNKVGELKILEPKHAAEKPTVAKIFPSRTKSKAKKGKDEDGSLGKARSPHPGYPIGERVREKKDAESD